MFKHVDDRALAQDIMGMVERPITRAGLREDESRALAILEDPIEFAQNTARVLQGGELQGMLINAMPVIPEKQLTELQRMLSDAIDQRDWEAAAKLNDRLNDESNYATCAAQEFGTALGAVMEQLRGGLLDVVRLRNAGMTRAESSTADDIAELRSLLNLRDSVQKTRKHVQAAD